MDKLGSLQQEIYLRHLQATKHASIWPRARLLYMRKHSSLFVNISLNRASVGECVLPHCFRIYKYFYVLCCSVYVYMFIAGKDPIYTRTCLCFVFTVNTCMFMCM